MCPAMACRPAYAKVTLSLKMADFTRLDIDADAFTCEKAEVSESEAEKEARHNGVWALADPIRPFVPSNAAE